MKKIITYGEMEDNDITNASLELISKAFDMKLQSKNDFNNDISIVTVVITPTIDEGIKDKIYNAGADKIVLIKSQSEEFISTTYSKFFIEYFKQNPSDIVLFPASQKIRTLAPRITTSLETGLVADCTELELILKDNEIKLASTRPTFGGELMAVILSKKNPQCATIRPGTFKIKKTDTIKKDYIEFIPSNQEDKRIKLIKTLLENSSLRGNLTSAKIILAGGYGIVSNDKKEYFEKLNTIAKKINASTACTRKVVDYGIMPSSCQIGQTGTTVEAELYIAFGISGAIQHIMGMKNSKTIIAINTDNNADIFKYSDYKITADAKTVIDDLLDMLS